MLEIVNTFVKENLSEWLENNLVWRSEAYCCQYLERLTLFHLQSHLLPGVMFVHAPKFHLVDESCWEWLLVAAGSVQD